MKKIGDDILNEPITIKMEKTFNVTSIRIKDNGKFTK